MKREEKLETIVKLFAKNMFYGDWKWETPNERVIQMLMEKIGLYPFDDEDDWTFNYQITDKPIGKMRDLDEYEFIEGVYVNQTTNGGYTGDDFAGTCSIKISENEYFQFNYSM